MKKISTEKTNYDYKPILDHLRKLDYLYGIGLVRTWITRRVVGFNVSASSLLRKNFTLLRIQDEIEKHNLPLIVEDNLGAGYTSFRLMIKL